MTFEESDKIWKLHPLARINRIEELGQEDGTLWEIADQAIGRSGMDPLDVLQAIHRDLKRRLRAAEDSQRPNDPTNKNIIRLSSKVRDLESSINRLIVAKLGN